MGLEIGNLIDQGKEIAKGIVRGIVKGIELETGIGIGMAGICLLGALQTWSDEIRITCLPYIFSCNHSCRTDMGAYDSLVSNSISLPTFWLIAWHVCWLAGQERTGTDLPALTGNAQIDTALITGNEIGALLDPSGHLTAQPCWRDSLIFEHRLNLRPW